jgi:hypothetical protein
VDAAAPADDPVDVRAERVRLVEILQGGCVVAEPFVHLAAFGQGGSPVGIVEGRISGEAGQQHEFVGRAALEPRRQLLATALDVGQACVLASLGDHLRPLGGGVAGAAVAVDEAEQCTGQ